MKKTLAVLTLALTMMITSGCGTFNGGDNMTPEQSFAMTNLARRVEYLRDRDLRWQACVRQQAIQNAQAQQQAVLAQQWATTAKQETMVALKKAEEAVKTAEELKKKQLLVTQEPNMGVAKKPTPEKLREEIALLQTKIKKVQDERDALSIQVRNSYGIDAITKLQKEIEVNELARRELEQELERKTVELKKL